MSPINKNPTLILGAPVGWNEDKHGPCAGLPIINANDHMYSYWKVSWSERLKLLCGTPIRLAIFGSRHPPVALKATKS